MIRVVFFILLFLFIPWTALHAEVQTKSIEYAHGELKLKGHFAWDDSTKGKRPGVLVVHEWWGLNDYARQRAGTVSLNGICRVRLRYVWNGEGHHSS